MPFVIASPCIDVKDKACLKVCPVDCISDGGRTLYIPPTECIDCGLSETVCPADAIHADDALKVIFGGKKSVSMFEMTKHVSKHLK